MVFARPLAIRIAYETSARFRPDDDCGLDQLAESHRIYVIPVRAITHPERQNPVLTRSLATLGSGSLRYELTGVGLAFTDNQVLVTWRFNQDVNHRLGPFFSGFYLRFG